MKCNPQRLPDFVLLCTPNSVDEELALPNRRLGSKFALENVNAFITTRTVNMSDVRQWMTRGDDLKTQVLKNSRIKFLQSLIDCIHERYR